MRLRIQHETVYRFETPAARAIEVLRLTPRGHDGQFVVGWRIDVSRDCRLENTTDPFGNAVHSFTIEGPLDELVIIAGGEVETQDLAGVVRGQVERMPAMVFLRDTALTEADEAIRALGAGAAAATPDTLSAMHALMAMIGERVAFEAGDAATPGGARACLAAGRGGCGDIAHIFIAAARHLGIPARYVSGYLHRADPAAADACHAWAEVLVPKLGWVGFDAAEGMSPTDAYVRVAVGLDRLGAAPVRGTCYGGSGETVSVSISVREADKPFR